MVVPTDIKILIPAVIKARKSPVLPYNCSYACNSIGIFVKRPRYSKLFPYFPRTLCFLHRSVSLVNWILGRKISNMLFFIEISK